MSQPVKKSFSRRVLLWLDQGLNVWLGPLFNWLYKTNKFGDEDEVVSSVLGKLKADGKAERFRNAVDWVFLHLTGEKDHCINNIEMDEGKKVEEAAAVKCIEHLTTADPQG